MIKFVRILEIYKYVKYNKQLSLLPAKTAITRLGMKLNWD